jgi:CheY-like chemotaxis protein
MPATAPIVVIEDDIDDQHLLVEIFDKLGFQNKVFYFADGHAALAFLRIAEVKPLLILADINMPKLNGFEVREHILADEHLRKKCIPFVFFTTASDDRTISHAHATPIQGYFIKPRKMEEFESLIRKILEYWMVSVPVKPC